MPIGTEGVRRSRTGCEGGYTHVRCRDSSGPVRHDGTVDVREVLLPGVGIRYEFTTRAGVSIGLVTRRDGGAEFVVYDREDPDESRAVLSLDEREAMTLAELLGAPRIA